MPIKVSKDLPAIKELAKENIFVMDELRAVTQDIRPLKIIIVNLMPTKQATETHPFTFEHIPAGGSDLAADGKL